MVSLVVKSEEGVDVLDEDLFLFGLYAQLAIDAQNAFEVLHGTLTSHAGQGLEGPSGEAKDSPAIPLAEWVERHPSAARGSARVSRIELVFENFTSFSSGVRGWWWCVSERLGSSAPA